MLALLHERGLHELRARAATHVGPSNRKAAFDLLLTPGARNYWKSHDLVELGDGLIDTLLDAVRRLPSPPCEVLIAAPLISPACK